MENKVQLRGFKRGGSFKTEAYHREICKEKRLRIVSGNVRANHVHLLVSCPSDLAPSRIVQYLKGKSSYRLQREFKEIQKRYWGQYLWGRGYFCSTVGAVSEEMIKRYVEHQSEEIDAFSVWDVNETVEEKKELKPDKNGLEP